MAPFCDHLPSCGPTGRPREVHETTPVLGDEVGLDQHRARPNRLDRVDPSPRQGLPLRRQKFDGQRDNRNQVQVENNSGALDQSGSDTHRPSPRLPFRGVDDQDSDNIRSYIRLGLERNVHSPCTRIPAFPLHHKRWHAERVGLRVETHVADTYRPDKAGHTALDADADDTDMIWGTWPGPRAHAKKSAFSWWNLAKEFYKLLRDLEDAGEEDPEEI